MSLLATLMEDRQRQRRQGLDPMSFSRTELSNSKRNQLAMANADPLEAAPDVTAAEDDGINFIDAADIWRAPVRGAARFGESVLNLAKDGLNLVRWGWGKLTGDELTEEEKFKDFDFDPALTAMMGETDSLFGGLLEGAVQFALGMTASTKMLTGLKWTANFAQNGGWLAGAAKGAMADFISFDEHDQRLSNLVETYMPSLSTPLTEWLAADEDDGVIEGRLKNAIEGLGLGAITDSLFKMFRGYKGLGKIKSALADTPVGQVFSEEARTAAKKAEELLYEASDEIVSHLEQRSQDIVKDVNYTLTGKEMLAADPEVSAQALKDAPGMESRVKDIPAPDVATPETAQKFFEQLDSTLAKSGKRGEAGLDDVVRTADGTLIGWNKRPITTDQEIKAVAEVLTSGAERAVLTDHNLLLQAAELFDEAGLSIAELAPAEIPAERLPAIIAANAVALTKLSHQVQPMLHAFRGKLQRGLRPTAAEFTELGDALGVLQRYGKARVQLGNVAGRSLAAMRTDVALWAEAWKNLPGIAVEGRDPKAAKAIGSAMSRLLKAESKRLGRAAIDTSQRGTENLGNLFLSMNREEQVATVQRLLGAKTPKQLRRTLSAIEKTKAGKWAAAHNQAWVSGLLSSVKTQTVNAMSTAANLALRPMELSIGRMLGGEGARESLKDSWSLYQGVKEMFSSITTLEGRAAAIPDSGGLFDRLKSSVNSRPGISAVGEAFSSASPVLDKATKYEGRIDALSAEALDINPASAMGKVLDAFGAVSKVPFKFMVGADEFASQAAYRGHVKMQIMRDLRQAGLEETSENYASMLAERWDEFFDPDGRGLNQAAKKYAEEVTYTNTPTGPVENSIYSLLRTASNNPFLKPVIPFVRTPMNIVNFVWDRTPIMRQLREEVRADLTSGDPLRVGRRRGELATGCVLWTSAAILANEGRITGGGPDNPEAKALWLQAGNLPYSVRVGDKLVQYNRLDPYGMIFGMAADFAEMSAHITEEQRGELASMMTAALAKNLASKTYLKGINDAIQALFGGEAPMRSFFTSRVASYVPRSISQLKDDPYLREVRSYMDALKREVPGLSSTLAPRRNIFGEPVTLPHGLGWDMASPFAMTQLVDDPVKQELANLGHGFSMPPKMFGTMDLTQYRTRDGREAYDRYLELIGQVIVDGLRLHQALSAVMKTAEYQSQPAEAKNEYGDASERVKMIQRVLSLYKTAARRKLGAELPELRQYEQAKAAEQLRRNAAKRRTSGIMSLL